MTGHPAIVAALDRLASAVASLAEALEQDAAPAGQEADLAAAQASAANPYGSTRGPRIIPVKPHTYLNSLANLRDREHYTAASAAEVAEGVEPQCEASWGAEGNWYACLLPRGHSGQHKNDVAGWDAPALCPAQWGEPPETMLCSLPSGHDGNHSTAEHIEWGGRWETAEPGAKDGA